jgi:putative ubiquitin-RnfH superfamily antitoxin RatB of RatAB toxin-antitoxin module
MIRVEVAFARPDKQKIISLEVEEGSTAVDAVRQSGIVAVFPEIEPGSVDLGIFGKAIKSPSTHELRHGDRVEIYRPLKIDPKQARLNRAKNKD